MTAAPPRDVQAGRVFATGMKGRIAVLAVVAVALGVIIITLTVSVESSAGRIVVAVAGLAIGVANLAVVKALMEFGGAQRRMARELAAVRTGLRDVATDLHRTRGLTDQMAQERRGAAADLDRLRRSIDAVSADVHSAAERIAPIEATVERDTAEIANLGRATSDLRDARVELERAVTSSARKAERLTTGLSDLRRRTDERHVATNRRIERERWARLAGFAAQASSGRYPEVLLLQVTAHRTASTRVFDILRSHPAVYVEPLSFIWDELGLTGRRYPVALSDATGAGTSIVADGRVSVAIPSLRAPRQAMPDPSTGRVAIEKLHPQFFDFDAVRFAETLDALERSSDAQVVIVYQVREPLDVMWSMAEYKLRDESWQGDLQIEEIPELVARSFESLLALVALRPGTVLDYDDIDPASPALFEVGRAIDPSMPDDEVGDWLSRGFELTRVERISDTTFVGTRAERTEDGPDGRWSELTDLLDRSRHAYAELLAGGGAAAEGNEDAPSSSDRFRTSTRQREVI